MNIAIPGRFQLAADFEKRAAGFTFPTEVWNVAAELVESSEPTSAFELEKLTGQSSDQVREALGRLLAEKLVRQNLLSWKDYNTAREKAREAAKTAPKAIPQAAIGKIGPVENRPTVATPALPAKPTQEGVALRLGTIVPQQTTSSATNGWLWQKPDPAQVAAAKPVVASPTPDDDQPQGLLLRPLLEQIENLKGGGVEGQLLVYQVFLRVPYQLLHDEGIKSLHFVDKLTVIQNPALHAAIVKAAKDVAGIDLR